MGNPKCKKCGLLKCYCHKPGKWPVDPHPEPKDTRSGWGEIEGLTDEECWTTDREKDNLFSYLPHRFRTRKRKREPDPQQSFDFEETLKPLLPDCPDTEPKP